MIAVLAYNKANDEKGAGTMFYGPDTLLIEWDVDIAEKWGVRYHNGDKIICTILEERPDSFIVEANGVGDTGEQIITVSKDYVRAYMKKGMDNWKWLG